MSLTRRALAFGIPASIAIAVAAAAGKRAALAQTDSATEAWAKKLVVAAESQVGVTVVYDPAYVRIAYPGGDVPRDRGVCTDVVVRAYRDAFNIDLQQLVHDDMRAKFAAYPKTWGLKKPDPNIDHRRVPNIETFLARQGASVPITDNGEDYLPGDIVSQRLSGGQPHIGIVSEQRSSFGAARPLMIHNIGQGTRIEDILFLARIVGHYRYRPA